MFRSSLSHKKLKQIDIRKNHHYYLNVPQQINVLSPDQQNFNQQNESANSQSTHKNNSYTQQNEDLYFRKQSKLLRDLRSTSNKSNNNQQNNISEAFIFRVSSKNHLQDEPLTLDNVGQRNKEKKTKDLVKVLHEMKKKRQEYIQKEQFIPRSPIPLLKRQNCICLDEPQIEKFSNPIKKLPLLKKKQEVLTTKFTGSNVTQSNFQKLSDYGILEEQLQSKLNCLHQFIFQLQCNYLIFVKQSQSRQQIYFIEEINQDEKIIKSLMKKRWWWCESPEKSDDVQFYWSQKLNSQFLQQQKTHALLDKQQSKIVNSQNISNNYQDQYNFAQEQKLTLIKQNSKLHNHIDMNEIINSKKNLIKFIHIYQTLTNEETSQFLPYSINVASISEPKFTIYQIKYRLTNSLWLVKPGESIRVNSQIKLCSNTKQVSEYITSELKCPNRTFETFVIQQYIKPFLYYKRKFDICAYILITSFNGIIRVYFYDEVFGRTSCKEYQDNDFDPLIHFTNTHVQKESKSFSLYEPGNKISFEKLQEFFNSFKVNFKETIIPKLKIIATNIFKSLFTKMIFKDYTFEVQKILMKILGLNFILDTTFKPWFIDAKLNQSFFPDCPYHQQFLTQFIDNVLRYTLDILYPPPLNWPLNKKQLIENFTMQNKFSDIFDSRLDSETLLELYKNDIN